MCAYFQAALIIEVHLFMDVYSITKKRVPRWEKGTVCGNSTPVVLF